MNDSGKVARGTVVRAAMSSPSHGTLMGVIGILGLSECDQPPAAGNRISSSEPRATRFADLSRACVWGGYEAFKTLESIKVMKVIRVIRSLGYRRTIQ
jgi:hypothetical protein